VFILDFWVSLAMFLFHGSLWDKYIVQTICIGYDFWWRFFLAILNEFAQVLEQIYQEVKLTRKMVLCGSFVMVPNTMERYISSFILISWHGGTCQLATMTMRSLDPPWVCSRSNHLVPLASWFSVGSVWRRNLWPPNLYGHKLVGASPTDTIFYWIYL
jgi:hypothetical protein